MTSNENLPAKPRVSPLDFRNTDLVSRLLAATPPYLYNMSLLPNTYFFSEMLRSFVQAKNDASRVSGPSGLAPNSRRARKRAWTTPTAPPQKPEPTADWMLKSNNKQEDNPLELTIVKPDSPEIHEPPPFTPQLTTTTNQDLNSLVLPPPPPIWYPPLYPAPPYGVGIDPLHFFIDLRVSGHIYDRKQGGAKPPEVKAEAEPNLTDLVRQPRHASAFSVPNSSNPINLSPTSDRKFDVKSMGLDKSDNKTGTTYIMNNINSIYRQINETKPDDEAESKRVRKLKALIGLELVVDYMNRKPAGTSALQPTTPDLTDESTGSPTLDVVDN